MERVITTAFATACCFRSGTARGQAVGFGGRILPSSPSAQRGPKYYNSADTPLFNKSEQLYGLDQARQPAAKAGYLAVVEGLYRCADGAPVGHLPGGGDDGHGPERPARRSNCGALCRAWCWCFDADAGGETGVDRALEIFASQDVDLAIATLPAGLDPCDLLLEQGAEAVSAGAGCERGRPGVQAEPGAARRWAAGQSRRQRRAVDAVLGIIALAAAHAGPGRSVKARS